MNFTSRQLKAFLLVAQLQNFTRAADALCITPSGLSLLIRGLETQLGYRLFDRTTRSVALSDQGTQLLAVVRRNVVELEAAMSRIGRTAIEASHTLSIGAGLAVAANVLPQAIREFRSLHPEIRIQLIDADLGNIQQQVESGKLDMGLGFFDRAPGIRRTPFFRFSLLLIRPGSDPAPRRDTVTWSALRGENLLAQAPSNPAQRLINRYLADIGVQVPSTMLLNRLDTVIAMVEAGQGVAVVPSFVVPACRHRDVVLSRLINPTVSLEFQQIRSRARKLPVIGEEFTQFLQGYIARWAGRAGLL